MLSGNKKGAYNGKSYAMAVVTITTSMEMLKALLCDL
jgi:hypothetical protein